MRTRSRLGLLILPIAMLAAACSDDAPVAGQPTASNPPVTSGGGGGVGRLLRLAPFDSCAAFLDQVKAEALERVGPYGLDGGSVGVPPPVAIDTAAPTQGPLADMAAEAGAVADTVAPGDDSFTNVQEAGVDEPDLVKTDGDRIVAVVDATLHVISTDAGNPTVLGSVQLSSAPFEVVLHGDTAIVFGAEHGGSDVIYDDTPDAATSSFAPGWGGRATITDVGLTDPANPVVRSTVSVQGDYLSARLIGGKLRVALRSAPDALPWLYPSTPAGEDAATEANRAVVERSTLADWTPEFTLRSGDSTNTGQLVPCEALHGASTFTGFELVSVVDIDLAGGALVDAFGDQLSSVGVLGAGATVYSSPDRMYLASTRWDQPSGASTAVHAFALDPAGPTTYVASGELPGTLLNQFALDEHDGYLRVALTEQADRPEASESYVAVLAEQDGQLIQVGEVDGLGAGEQLYSVRLIGDVGFAVTFRQTDPFYVLDLSDPADPQMVGELKIPGYSSYLHPLPDTGLVLGVGQDADLDGRVRGVKLSVFDVSDPTDPVEVDTWVLDGATSGAEYDHRAFQVHGSTVILPVTDHTTGRAEAVVLDVTGGTITEVGRVGHTDGGQPSSDCRKLTIDDFPTEDSDYYWEALDGATVQLCPAGAIGGWAGDPDACWDESAEALDEATADSLGTQPGDRIQVCWPTATWEPPIERSFVLADGAELWTYSSGRLQANALPDLTLLGEVILAER